MNLHLIVKKQLAENETESSYTVHDVLHTLRRALYSYKLLIKNNVPSDINIKFSPNLMANSRKLNFLTNFYGKSSACVSSPCLNLYQHHYLINKLF